MTGEIEAYLHEMEPARRDTLLALRATLRRVLPQAEEALKYGMPAFVLDGKNVAGYAAFATHCAYYPMSGSVLERLADEVAAYTTSKGGLQFPIGGRLPVGLVRKLVQARLAEMADVANGKRIEYHSDGSHKAVGQMKDGQPHGRWTWYRRDGSRSRTGQYDHGVRTGTWTTWDQEGEAVATTLRGSR